MGDNWEGKNLDFNRDKGIICGGSPVTGAMYEQDNFYFGVSGNCLGPVMQGQPVEKPVEVVIEKPVEPVVEPLPEYVPAQNFPLDVVDMVKELAGQGRNSAEIHDHMNHIGVQVTRQKVAAILRRLNNDK